MNKSILVKDLPENWTISEVIAHSPENEKTQKSLEFSEMEGAIEVKASFDKETGLMLFPIYPKSYYDNHVSLTDRIEFRDILIIEKPKTEIPEKKCNHDLKFRYVDGHKLCEECGLEFGF